MKVFKFGGASVRNAEAVKNLSHILKQAAEPQLVVVVSAMDKITNALEQLLQSKMQEDGKTGTQFDAIASFHTEIANTLFPEEHKARGEIRSLLEALRSLALEAPAYTYNREYDRLVCYGEMLSSRIIHHFLTLEGINNTWLNAQNVIKTDSTFRAARVDMLQSEFLICSALQSGEMENHQLCLTQGFIGSDPEGNPTTIGREGSDYSAAIFAHALDAKEVVTWKDVPGLFNADPKLFRNASYIKHISFRETIELAYYGAKIIHPNTIKPLQNKNIPLKLKSFVNPRAEGSVINQDTSSDGQVESYIKKSKQVLISLLSKEYEFITESALSYIFAKFASFGLKINLMQNSAITFTACVDHDEDKIASLILELREAYHIRFNENVQLLTIRHYNQHIINTLVKEKEILVEQRNRTTVQYVIKN
ncbi:MAG: aspartate kinase [Bacteroidales bacterium]